MKPIYITLPSARPPANSKWERVASSGVSGVNQFKNIWKIIGHTRARANLNIVFKENNLDYFSRFKEC